MKKLSLFFLLTLIVYAPPVLACTVCGQNQPKALKNITHGVGPQGNLDYIIIIGGIIIVSFTLFYSLKFLIRPGEKHAGHIKNIVVDERY
jgi:hypothetical protein